MFSSLLIANRGEIACRIMETAKKMGIRTIAVYSDVDADARHVRLADEAVLIGPAEAALSYLDGAKIIAAAKQTGAEAIHPGYGFLSENPNFAESCTKAGIVFVGPSAKSMRQMALKDQAKRLMELANVPVTPGYHGDDQTETTLAAAAKDIGFPVLIKAVAGGGGRGMRKVEHKDEFLAALTSARRESLAAFGDDKVLVEKFITNPRHIEVQVFGDSHGQVVHFFERDCSVQRRHQKVVEEAPAPGMSDEMRAAMCGAAVKAAAAVNYVNAGTVEFIVDGSAPLNPDKFWFMEMNTRLQVEHPVTEAITGYDLVELQLKIAAGGAVPKQADILLKGHAMEVRLYAEQPDKGFMPSTGKLAVFDVANDEHIRLDTGYEAGDWVREFYDPMLAKIITHQPDRGQAVSVLGSALGSVHVWPVRTNAWFLEQILRSPEFGLGAHDTGFVDKYLDEMMGQRPTSAQIAAMMVQGSATEIAGVTSPSPWASLGGWRLNGQANVRTRTQIDGQVFDVEIQFAGDQQTILVDGELCTPIGVPSDYTVLVQPGGKRICFFNSNFWEISVPDASSEAGTLDALDSILAPMPGKVLEVRTELLASVVQGEVLVVMEAMKMEHALKAPRDGVVEVLNCKTGDQVVEAMVLVSLN
ncbi:MAG: ATP-grasp domain-containing protein [Robiginitomaculum sp.]|nr:ATP-grasp domain-containing protein [Robiginitomaculum sp.]